LGGYNSLVKSIVMDSLAKVPFMIMGRHLRGSKKQSNQLTLFLGADVAHPSPGTLRPSVTSLVWSYDMKGGQYVAFTRLQHPRQEIIANLKEMVGDAVESFGQKYKVPPQRLIFYRDGVSEGEIPQVAQSEISAIKGSWLSYLRQV
jgi:eukaryotic translation initiation factor 2C